MLRLIRLSAHEGLWLTAIILVASVVVALVAGIFAFDRKDDASPFEPIQSWQTPMPVRSQIDGVPAVRTNPGIVTITWNVCIDGKQTDDQDVEIIGKVYWRSVDLAEPKDFTITPKLREFFIQPGCNAADDPHVLSMPLHPDIIDIAQSGVVTRWQIVAEIAPKLGEHIGDERIVQSESFGVIP